MISTVRFSCGVAVVVLISLTTNHETYVEPSELSVELPQYVETIHNSVVSQARQRGLLRIGFDFFEPWTMCDKNGELVGHEIDVARKLAVDMGVRIQFVRTEWYFIIAALIDERFDVIVSGMSITPDRALLINFSDPVGQSGTAIVANTALVPDTTNLNDADVIIAVRPGTTTEATVQKRFPNATLLPVSTPDEMLRVILDGSAHAAAVAQVTATRWILAHPDELRNTFDKLIDPLPEAIALRKGDIDGLNFFDSWISLHQTNGWLNERRHYWFETRVWEDQVATDPDVIAACIASHEG